LALKEKIEVLPDGSVKIDAKTGDQLSKRGGQKPLSLKRSLGIPTKGQNRIAGKRNHFSEQKKLEVACAFAVTGNSRRTSELTDVPEGTIRSWKSTEWWHEIQSRILMEQDEELDVKLTKLVDKAVESVNDRLDHGDYVYNAKDDKLVRKPVGARDLAIITAITVDKRQLLRGQPTARVEKVSTDERLKKLSDHFKQFSLARDITNESTIEEEIPIEEIASTEEEVLIEAC
jgi:hypothetical protein